MLLLNAHAGQRSGLQRSKEKTMEDEKPEIMHPLSPEPKSPLGSIKTSKPEREVEKPAPSIPPTPESKSDEFVKGYKAGYADGKGGKEPTF